MSGGDGMGLAACLAGALAIVVMRRHRRERQAMGMAETMLEDLRLRMKIKRLLGPKETTPAKAHAAQRAQGDTDLDDAPGHYRGDEGFTQPHQ